MRWSSALPGLASTACSERPRVAASAPDHQQGRGAILVDGGEGVELVEQVGAAGDPVAGRARVVTARGLVVVDELVGERVGALVGVLGQRGDRDRGLLRGLLAAQVAGAGNQLLSDLGRRYGRLGENAGAEDLGDLEPAGRSQHHRRRRHGIPARSHLGNPE
jgi:hypothetical protein